MIVVNNGIESYPVPLTTGGFEEVAAGESKEVENIDLDHGSVIGQRHAGRIQILDNSKEGEEAAEAKTGTAASPMNEPTPDRSTGKNRNPDFKSLSASSEKTGSSE